MFPEDNFQPCSDNCVCQDYPQERGACEADKAATAKLQCSDECRLDCSCDEVEALQSFARSVDRLSEAVLLLGQMIDERIYGRSI